MDIHDISKAILEHPNLTYDDINLLSTVLKTKRERIARAQKLGVGDRVVIRQCKPKYLEGMHATVTSVQGQKLGIQIDEHYNTRRYSKALTVPLTLVERL